MDLLNQAKEAIAKAIQDNKELSNRAIYHTFSEDTAEREDGLFLLKYADKEEKNLQVLSDKPQVAINATPHTVNVYDEDMNRFYSIPPSGILPRVSTPVSSESKEAFIFLNPSRTINVKVETAPVSSIVEGLPPYQEGVYYIVSALVRSACPDRTDLLQVIPHRNEEGVIIGALGFTRNLV